MEGWRYPLYGNSELLSRILIAGIKKMSCETDVLPKLQSCKMYCVLHFNSFLVVHKQVAWLNLLTKRWDSSALMVERKVSKVTRSVIGKRGKKKKNRLSRNHIKLCLYNYSISRSTKSFMPNVLGQINERFLCVRITGSQTSFSFNYYVLSLCMLMQCMKTLIVLITANSWAR